MPEGQADAPTELDISLAMIKAGVEAIRGYDFELWEATSPEDGTRLVTSIFNAMCAAKESAR